MQVGSRAETNGQGRPNWGYKPKQTSGTRREQVTSQDKTERASESSPEKQDQAKPKPFLEKPDLKGKLSTQNFFRLKQENLSDSAWDGLASPTGLSLFCY